VSAEWIARRTGILERRYADPDERVSELAVRAARAALADGGCEASEVDLVLVATLAPDEVTPSTAPQVAHALGTANAGAIDVGAACTGSLAGLALASATIQAGQARNVLVIGAEILSRFVDLDDRRTAPLFGDGAGAMLVCADAPGRLGPFLLASDGAAAGMIRVGRASGVFEMEGHETFLNAVHRLSTGTEDLLSRAGLGLADIDLFIYHQANSRILKSVAERLDLPPARVYDCIAEMGNTSAASLPLALGLAREAGVLRPGMLVLLGAVGAGLTWGAALMRWEFA
jgi:3-oxoacyl-[acyl-carrier-protein] synthase-3